MYWFVLYRPRIDMKLALLGFCLFGACATGAGVADHALRGPRPSLPNIVLINADDLGYGDLGCYGATKVRTPNIDRLAQQGRRFTDAHAASAVCSPSRYGLLTGRYPLRRNFWGPVPADSPLTIDPTHWTLASLLQGSGYATACIGKWHLGFGSAAGNRQGIVWNGVLTPGPLEVGFDSYFGIPLVNSGPPFVFVEDHRVVGFDPADPFVRGKKSVTQVWPAKGGYNRYGGAEVAHRLYRDEALGTELTSRAVHWIQQADPQKPFFLYFATTQIHHPFTPAKRFLGTSQCGRYGDFIHELDWMVGELLAALDERGLARETLVIFTSDNGGMLNHGGQDAWRAGHRLNGDRLGFKFGAWEGGHRIPFLVRWPGVVPAGTVSDDMISQVDLLATFAGIVKHPLPDGQGQDSVDVLPTFTGRRSESDPSPRQSLIISPNSAAHLVMREGDWVYIPAQGAGGFSGSKVGDHTFGGPPTTTFTGDKNSDIRDGVVLPDAPPGQLYNLKNDPRQTTNLYREHPKVVASMAATLAAYREEVGETPPVGWIDPGNR